MGLLDEFEEWLIGRMGCGEEGVKPITRRNWEDDFLDSASIADIEEVLRSMALFAIQRALGARRLSDERFNWAVVEKAEKAYGSMELYILEMNTRTVIASLDGDLAEVTPRKLEDMLRSLISQIKESEKMLALRLVVDGRP